MSENNSDSYSENESERESMSNNSQIDNITNDLNLQSEGKSDGVGKFIYYDKTLLEENEKNIPSLNKNDKISFADVLKGFNVPSVMNETNQAKLKKTLENFIKNKDKNKVEIKFNDTSGKILERSSNYSNLVKEISVYQDKVKINREADVVDFTNRHNHSSIIPNTAKSIANNTYTYEDMNDYEKKIKEILVKNKCDTDDKILEQENKLLLNLNPEELKKRHDELKKLKFLLFQQEISHKRKAKIKSKLFHKIKKKQKEREEQLILEQLEDVDPEGVKNYLEKKKLDRIKERIELKHSFNSKFNKTVKRYNLHNDVEVREKIKENYKLRDELMKKIKGNVEEGDDEENDIEDDMEGEEEEEDILEEDEDDNNGDDDVEEVDQNENEEIDEKGNLLLNFDENEGKVKTNNKRTQNKPTGVFGMKFMKNSEKSENLQSKLKDVLNEIDSDEDLMIEDDEEDKNYNKKYSRQKKSNEDSDEEMRMEIDKKKYILPKKINNANKKNIETKKNQDFSTQPHLPKKITNEVKLN
jgi:U3 small nucleolar RNA-associated protein 14